MANNIYKNADGYNDYTAGKAIKNYIKSEEKKNMSINRGDIYCRERKGKEEYEYYLVVSRQERCSKGSNVVVVKLGEERSNLLVSQTNVVCRGIMTVNCDLLYYVYAHEIGELVRTCTDEEMKRVDMCIIESLGLGKIQDEKCNDLLKENAVLREKIENMMIEHVEKHEAAANQYETEILETEYDYEALEERIRVKVERDFYKKKYEELFAKLLGGASCA